MNVSGGETRGEFIKEWSFKSLHGSSGRQKWLTYFTVLCIYPYTLTLYVSILYIYSSTSSSLRKCLLFLQYILDEFFWRKFNSGIRRWIKYAIIKVCLKDFFIFYLFPHLLHILYFLNFIECSWWQDGCEIKKEWKENIIEGLEGVKIYNN